MIPADRAADGPDWADRAARRWAARYTSDLDPETAHRRRAELESDLFEHRWCAGPGPAQQWDVLGRVLWGIPADLSWRRAALASMRRRDTGATPVILRRTTTIVLVALAAFELAAGISVVTADGAGWRYAVPLLLGAALIAVGFSQRDRSPASAAALFVVAALVPAATFYWMAPVFVPVVILVAVLVVVAARRTPRPSPAV